MRLAVLWFGLLGWGCLGWMPEAGAGALAEDALFQMQLLAETKAVHVAYRGRPLLVYRFGPSPLKPYVSELYSLDGANVILDAPDDHPHHHGLMYAVKVNDLTFWEETLESGRQVTGPELVRRVFRNASDRVVAEIAHDVLWVPPGAQVVLSESAWLMESRTLQVTVDEAEGEVALEWHSRFQAGPSLPRVVLSGTGYQGLGVRPAKAFDRTARRRNAAGAAYTQDGVWDVTAANWASLSQEVQGRTVTLTVFSDPSNGGESRFFSRLNPFAYLAATQGLESRPLEYEAGARFGTRYLLTVTRGEPTNEWQEARRTRWLLP